MAHSFIQSIVKGVHSFCPNNKYSSVLPTSGSQDIALHSAEASEVLYTYQYIYGQTPPPLGEVINILDEESSEEDTSSEEEDDAATRRQCAINGAEMDNNKIFFSKDPSLKVQ